jgi:hypothetical protein
MPDSNSIVKIYHFPVYGVTVAISEACKNGDFLHFAVAQCSNADTYSKKRGKQAAIAAWESGEVLAIRKGRLQSLKKHAESIAAFFGNGTNKVNTPTEYSVESLHTAAARYIANHS